jgi:hypothetical protein
MDLHSEATSGTNITGYCHNPDQPVEYDVQTIERLVMPTGMKQPHKDRIEDKTMATLDFSGNQLPALAEFLQQLREADDQYDPVEKLLTLERQLAVLEQKHGIISAEFFQRYQAGAMGDSVEFVGWAGRYRLYRELKAAISASLKLIVSESHPMPA